MLLGLAGAALSQPVIAWQPVNPVELIVPAASVSRASQMAELIVQIVKQHELLPVPLYVTNDTGSLGAAAYLDLEAARGEPNKLLLSLAGAFTIPRVTGAAFDIQEFTPVAMLARDTYVLWVNAESPHRSAKEYLAAAVAAGPEGLRMGGTGYERGDHLITAMLERASRAKFLYLLYPEGGAVAEDLATGALDSSLNNPLEALGEWRRNSVRPLCVLGEARLSSGAKIAGTAAWRDIPTCKETGVDVAFETMRGIFLPPDVGREQVEYYAEVFERVVHTPEWKAYLARSGMKDSFMRGRAFADWIEKTKAARGKLMQMAGFSEQ
jgi:tripartite-type tricarboxylate transporter receptor subunit TctC